MWNRPELLKGLAIHAAITKLSHHHQAKAPTLVSKSIARCIIKTQLTNEQDQVRFCSCTFIAACANRIIDSLFTVQL